MPLRSMTAFGSGEFESSDFRYVCEMKSLNSRFLEVNARLPRFLSSLEPEIVQFMKSKLDRGKVDLYFDIRSQNIAGTLPKVNSDAVKHYLNCAKTIAEISGSKGSTSESPISVSNLMRLEGVMDTDAIHSSSKAQANIHKEPLLKAISAALNELIVDREREGQTLFTSIDEHLQSLRSQYEEVKTIAPVVREKLEANYFNKIENLKKALIEKGQISDSDLSNERLTTELVIMIDKIDVAEELDRLVAHIDEFSDQMKIGDKVGRRLDFICQEMHREVNTLSNKLITAEVSKISVSMKQNVERIKQQVQNIE